jgi:serine protease Do
MPHEILTWTPRIQRYPRLVAAGTILTLAWTGLARSQTSSPASEPSPAEEVGPVVNLEAIQKAFEVLAEKIDPTVVTIKAARTPESPLTNHQTDSESRKRRALLRRTYGAGSGVIIRSDGMILTTEHVIHGADEIFVHLHDGQEFGASIVQSDVRSDLAILSIPTTGLKAATLGDVNDLRQGHLVFALGNPFGVASEVGKASMSWGIVSALGRPLPLLGAADDRYYGNLIETTASINPGNSGGPLFDIHGHVVGIMAAISTRTGRSDGVGFAVPISRRTRQIIAMLMQGEEVEYGLLGAVVQTPDDAQRVKAGGPHSLGALVDAVDVDSPASRIRIRPGDLIIKFDGQDVFGADHLVRMVGSRPGRRTGLLPQQAEVHGPGGTGPSRPHRPRSQWSDSLAGPDDHDRHRRCRPRTADHRQHRQAPRPAGHLRPSQFAGRSSRLSAGNGPRSDRRRGGGHARRPPSDRPANPRHRCGRPPGRREALAAPIGVTTRAVPSRALH